MIFLLPLLIGLFLILVACAGSYERRYILAPVAGILAAFFLVMAGAISGGDSTIRVKHVEMGQVYVRNDSQLLLTQTESGQVGNCMYLRLVRVDKPDAWLKPEAYFIPYDQWYPGTNAYAVGVKYSDGSKRLAPYQMPNTNSTTTAEAPGR
jgi:hypothetical protein